MKYNGKAPGNLVHQHVDRLARHRQRPLAVAPLQAAVALQARFEGRVREIRHGAWGFIVSEGTDVFFHLSSVFGARPVVGSTVLYSKFNGGGAERAHPVVVTQDV